MSQETGRVFGDWVRYRLKVLGMSQGQLARTLGMDQGYLSRIMTGKAIPFPTPERAKEFADALDSNVVDMMRYMGYFDTGCHHQHRTVRGLRDGKTGTPQLRIGHLFHFPEHPVRMGISVRGKSQGVRGW